MAAIFLFLICQPAKWSCHTAWYSNFTPLEMHVTHGQGQNALRPFL